MENFNSLESKKVFSFFKEISMIPRNSGEEKAISDFLKKFAEDRNLEVYQDKANNVIIKKPGTFGLEQASTIMLQGHMDMVCEKTKESYHDFSKDPIEWVIEGNKLKAKDTTLGADNGVGVAFSMALLDSKDIPHPPLEVIITTDEETSMSGAEFLDMSGLNGKILLNLDTEEEGKFYLSSAGGCTQLVSLPYTLVDVTGQQIEVTISNLLGGHSGLEIHKEHANANKLLGRFLWQLKKENLPFHIQSLSGGTKDNAIPREANCLFVINEQDYKKLESLTAKLTAQLKQEYSPQDPHITIHLSRKEQGKMPCLPGDTGLKVATLLQLIPYGPLFHSQYLENLVQTSNNLGVVRMTEKEITFKSAIRSSLESQTRQVADEIESLAFVAGANARAFDFYAAWPYDDSSQLKNACLDTYESLFHKKGELVAIHAGLECGTFKEKMPDLDMISFGPNIFGAHTPNEYVEIDSVERTWIFTKALLKNLNTYV